MTYPNGVRVSVPVPDNENVLILISNRLPSGKLSTEYTTMSIVGFRSNDAARMDALRELAHKIENSIQEDQTGGGMSPTEVSDRALGMDIISEMSDQELIEEIIGHQRAALSDFDRNKLKHHVVHLRLSLYHRRLHEEAKMDPPTFLGFLGGFGDQE